MNKLVLSIMMFGTMTVADDKSPIRAYIDKNGMDKINKQIVIEAMPVTAKGYEDGHGRNPRLTSEEQIPDTMALISWYIFDKGNEVKGGYYLYTYSLSANGGNYVANGLHSAAIDSLKQTYRNMGIVLLTPEQFLDTEAKKTYYTTAFQPKVSKLGSFLSGIETKGVDMSVCADFYRGFDLSVAADHERMESLGYDLANQLGVDGVLSIGFEVASSNKEISLCGMRMAIHGPNPIAKQDKKYVSQNLGAGYYAGQHYSGAVFYFKQPQRIAEVEKKVIKNEKYDGVGAVLSAMAKKMDASMKEAIAENKK